MLILQEVDSEVTNNGIHYRLQLLYANGKILRIHLCILLISKQVKILNCQKNILLAEQL